MRDIILRTIAEADEEDSKLYVKAAVKRREELLNGGEVGYLEFTKEWVAHRDWLTEEVKRFLAEEGNEEWNEEDSDTDTRENIEI